MEPWLKENLVAMIMLIIILQKKCRITVIRMMQVKERIAQS